MRVAFLPTPGDPYLIKYWLKWFNVWKDEVDKLYIHFNSPVEIEAFEYVADLCREYGDKVVLFYTDHMADHGNSLKQMLLRSEGEYIMFVEDDGIIFRPGVVDEQFRKLETDQYDIVGSPRGSCSEEIVHAADKVFGETNFPQTGIPDTGPNFWPNFFFCKRSDLMKTDLEFGAKTWQRGDYIEPLKHTVENDIAVGDTFVWGSLQLRGMGLRIGYIRQYHGSPDDIDHYEQRYNIFDGLCPWFHIGSLSSGLSGMLRDDFGRPLDKRTTMEPQDTTFPDHCHTEAEQREWERRVQWWSTFVDEAPTNRLLSFREDYEKAVERIIREYKLGRKSIRRRKLMYKEVMGDV